ncbi:IclR family transcriptional regulator [Oceanibacterium hippocampi]|uniref:Pca regulon regulatory protein n=1 Tax=Oceanibacterium hippocampi TaxID=745714 RepID=A0A1Y5TXR3_9PROT|nr:IclR family transcriptional regulator [Oceanibacterium hippocampi]SLN76367.1 Pca regulon regulatory protein [Oceanibacterium hippocampi]
MTDPSAEAPGMQMNPEGERDTEKDRHFVTALARGLDILRAFRPGEGPLNNQVLSARTGLPRSTVSRLTSTLTRLGYLTQRGERGAYEPTTAVVALGYTVLANNRLRSLARPMMAELARDADLAVAMGSRDDLAMIYVEICQGRGNLALYLDIGSRLPLALTSMGRAYMAALDEAERLPLLDAIRREADPADWPRIARGIEQAFEDYATAGFCLSAGDWQRDVFAVGVPLRDKPNGRLAALNAGGPRYRVDLDWLRNEIAPRLVALARNVEGMCGWR